MNTQQTRGLTPVGAVASVRPVAGVDVETALWSPRLLGAVERGRWEKLAKQENRDGFLAARAVAAQCVAALLDEGGRPEGLDLEASGVTFTQQCPECRRPGHGRPRVASAPGVRVSWSHSRGHVVAVAAWQQCGVDVEEVRRLPVPDRAFTVREREWMRAGKAPARASLRLWTRKEALVKCGALDLARLGEVDLLDERGTAPASVRDGFVLGEQGVGDGLGSAVVAFALAVGDGTAPPAVSWI